MAIAKTFALEHEEEVKNGRRLGSIDDLAPLEWAAVRGLSRGRAKYEEHKDEQRMTELAARRAAADQNK